MVGRENIRTEHVCIYMRLCKSCHSSWLCPLTLEMPRWTCEMFLTVWIAQLPLKHFCHHWLHAGIPLTSFLTVNDQVIAVAGNLLCSFAAFATVGGLVGSFDTTDQSPHCNGAIVEPYAVDSWDKAIIPITSFIHDLNNGEIESIDVPALSFISETDATPIPHQTDPARAHLPSCPSYHIDLLGAGNASITNTCDLIILLLGVSWWC